MTNKTLLSTVVLASMAQFAAAGNAGEQSHPNIILILCDDMGFSDLGCYGGEVKTPNIDFLAENGVRFSQFKNTERSCPSRAALLTGRYQHEAGMGWMTAVDEHRPGYRGQISADYPTIAEVLKANGYATYMSGKWHLTVQGAFDKPNGSYPTQRGFDKYYGCLSGGGSYYTPTLRIQTVSRHSPTTFIIQRPLRIRPSVSSIAIRPMSRCSCIWRIMPLTGRCRHPKNGWKHAGNGIK